MTNVGFVALKNKLAFFKCLTSREKVKIYLQFKDVKKTS